MAQRMKYKSCLGCIHLQKENPIISGDMALYQCTSQKRNGRCVGWVQKDRPDSGLNQQGGSCCNVLHIGDILTKKSLFNNCLKNWLYCGNISKNKRLLFCVKTNEYRVVEHDYLRSQTGKFKNGVTVVQQTTEQIEFHKRLAKRMKEKWLKEHE